MSRAIRLTDLAKEAESDLDDALVTLWDAGFDDLESPNDLIPSNQISKARAALLIDPPREQMKVQYWLSKLSITREEFTQVLLDLGVKNLSQNVRTLPKGALRKLRRKYLGTHSTEESTEKVHESKLILEPSRQPCPPFEWKTIGSPCQVQYLSTEDVISIHDALVKDFATDKDPISPPGLRDENLLTSAITRAQTGYGNHLKYPTVEMAGAALLHSLVLNHAFHNGNKRTGLVSLLVFLDKNSLMPEFLENDLFKWTLRVAQHGLVPLQCNDLADREVLKLAEWIEDNSRKILKGDRPIQWYKLKRILHRYKCRYATANVGNRIDIYRTVERSRLGRKYSRTLRVQAHYRNDGDEIEPNTVHHIRKRLELDEDHGYDSKTFYETAEEPDDFIQKYRTLLRRLAQF